MVMTKTDEARALPARGSTEGRNLQRGRATQAGVSLSRRQKAVTDTAGLQPIDVTFDLARAVGVTGRLIDKQTGRAVPCDVVIPPAAEQPQPPG